MQNTNINENDLQYLEESIQRLTQALETDEFTSVKVWPDSEVYEASEEVTYKSDDYITVDSLERFNRLMSPHLFNSDELEGVIGQILDIQGIEL